MITAPSPTSKPWWQGAVIYQIYPRSFQDSDGDGVGDLQGIINRLPYIADLGADAIWICPFFTSPQKDFGYDVSDYRGIDPLFGSMNDCDALITSAHALGLKVVFDLVLSHTSDQHDWFQDSRRKRSNKTDWYVWADPKPDGSPPNNWVSLFGGPAWSFDPLRGQYYLHNFLKEQPDLNYHNPAVQTEALNILRFWLDRGVDGVRLDTVNFYMHDEQLRDNPARGDMGGFALQFEKPDPYNMQRHVYDKSQPENLAFIEALRTVTNTYPDRVLIGEIGDDAPNVRAAEYTQGATRLHTAYSLALMGGTAKTVTPATIRDAIEAEYAASGGTSWPSWAFSNHDVVRVRSRWGGAHTDHADWPKMLISLLLCLRGTLCLYQGEELGLTESSLEAHELQDPWGKYLYPEWQGRDGCRTPLPWDATGGFTTGTPWLPYAHAHLTMNVAAQMRDTQSMLQHTRAMLALRKQHSALLYGDMVFLDAPAPLLAFTRTHAGTNVLCAFNLSDQAVSVPLSAALSSGVTSLPAFGSWIAVL